MSDILSHGPDGPRWRPPRWLGALGAVVVVAAVIAALVLRGGGGEAERSPTPSDSSVPQAGTSTVAAVPSPTVDASLTAAVMVSRRSAFGNTLDRQDGHAKDGPWAVVVRRDDGSLGRHGAVVTFPVHATNGGVVQVGDVVGRTTPNAVTWPIAGKYARIRGDLGRADLVRLAERTRINGARPRVRPPDGFAVAYRPEPYRSPHVHEARYGPGDLIVAGKVGGLVFTALAHGGAFEDRLYAQGARPAGKVHGHPAVLSSVGGGNATLAWEPAPGIVAYVGYSGTPPKHREAAMLHHLADRTIPLSLGQWRHTDPVHVHATNDYR